MQTTLIHRMAKQSGPYKGETWLTLMAQQIEGSVYVAAAIVNLRMKDKFNKKIGDAIASGRISTAMSDESRRILMFDDKDVKRATGGWHVYHSTIGKPMRRFITRCFRYFKDAPIFLAAPKAAGAWTLNKKPPAESPSQG
jgi:hypothetical protein